MGDGFTQPFGASDGGAAQPSGGKRQAQSSAAAGESADCPHEYMSNLNSQRAPEVLYNFGLALFKDKKYVQAFQTFEKASNALRGNPRLWYYMGLSVLHLNKQQEQKLNG